MSRPRKFALFAACLAAGPFFPLVLIGFAIGRDRAPAALPPGVVRLADHRP